MYNIDTEVNKTLTFLNNFYLQYLVYLIKEKEHLIKKGELVFLQKCEKLKGFLTRYSLRKNIPSQLVDKYMKELKKLNQVIITDTKTTINDTLLITISEKIDTSLNKMKKIESINQRRDG